MNSQRKYHLKKWAYRRYKGCCAYCGTKLTLEEATLDHIVPRALGGTNRQDNLALSCRECNEKKGHMTPQAWRMELLV